MSSLGQRLAGKRFGLVLSAGYFGFYGHTGFVEGLLASGLTPAAYAGTSAGGLVASFVAGGAPLSTVKALLLKQTRKGFWDPDPLGALLDVARGGHGPSGLLQGRRFRSLLEETLPVKRIEDCPSPLLLVAAHLSRATPAVFTAGELAPRVHATCAYPGLFRAVALEDGLYWDGGLVDKAPALALADSEAGRNLDALVVHYLPSRVREKLGGAFAFLHGMDAALAAVRHDHFRLQLRVLQGRRLPVYVVVSELPEVSPSSMEKGVEAMEAARRSAEQALAAPPQAFEGLEPEGAR